MVRFVIVCASILLAACEPDPIDAIGVGNLNDLYIEGTVDGELGVLIHLSELIPFDSTINTATSIDPVVDADIDLISQTGDTFALTMISPGTYGLDSIRLSVGTQYFIQASTNSGNLRSDVGVIPPLPRLMYSSPYYGSIPYEDYDIIMRIDALPDSGFALEFTGLTAGSLAVDFCNQEHDYNFVSNACREIYGTVSFDAGWFNEFEPGPTLTTVVSNVSPGYSDYVAVLEQNEFNWGQTGLFYIDPVIPPTNIQGGYGYISFQNSFRVVVDKPQ